MIKFANIHTFSLAFSF